MRMRLRTDLISTIRYDCWQAISKNTYHDPYDEHGQCTAGVHVIYNVYGAHNEYLTRPPERFLTVNRIEVGSRFWSRAGHLVPYQW